MGPRPDTDARIVPLPLLSPHTGGRSSITCTYRCGNACSHEVPNTSDNEYFGDVVRAAISRRGVLRAGAVVAVAAGAGVGLSGTAAAAPVPERWPRPGRGGFTFEPVPPNIDDKVTVPPGYESAIVIRWGDPVLPGAPAWDFANQTPAAQAGQFGYNNDFLALLPYRGPFQSLLVANHEYTTEVLMYPGYDEDAPTEQQIRTSWEAHGMSVVLVRRDWRSGTLTPEIDRVNRRLTVTTPFTLTGPVAGSALVSTTADPGGRSVLGTLNNCAGGVTPWGTVLSGEENFNQYFANAGAVADPVVQARLARYGVTTGASERKWETVDPRFDILIEPNEPNRFGWIVELDPYDPGSTPRKRTALGRFKHEGATVRVTRDGTVAAYMGDDERFDYMYKFVSSRRFRRGSGRRTREHNAGILDEGTLYVARFSGDSPPAEITGDGRLPSDGAFDGTGQWIPLARSDADGSGESFVPGFSLQDVLVFTRLAADVVGPTKMDRPEDVEPSPRTGKVYAALTNNTSRTGTRGAVDEANPRNQTLVAGAVSTGNKDGHVLELTEDRDDPTSTTFTWDLLLVCGDPADPSTYFGGFPKDQVSAISCPDNVAFDPAGNLWIATDGNALANSTGVKLNDGLFAVPLDGPNRGQVKQFLTVPRGAETCGPIIEERLVVVAAQHPGEYDPPASSDPPPTADAPFSRWPEGDASTNPPRPSVVSVWKPGRIRPEPIGG